MNTHTWHATRVADGHSLVEIPNALITQSWLSDDLRECGGVVYDSDGQLVPLSRRSLDRADGVSYTDPPWIAQLPRQVGQHKADGDHVYIRRAIFGGHVFDSWGHNLIEAVSTAWAGEMVTPDIPLIMIPWGRISHTVAPRTLRLLELAGWGQRTILIAAGNVHVDQLLIPERLVDIDAVLHEGAPIPADLARVYRDVVSSSAIDTPTDRRVFAARSDSHRRAHPYELEIQDRLHAVGFTISRGWEESVESQTRAFAAASLVVGFSGSNLHNTVFAPPGCRVIELRDARAIEWSGTRSSLQSALCALMNQHLDLVDTFAESEPRSADSIIAEIMDVVDADAGPD